MDVDSGLKHYAKAPRRIASAYAGTAVYENWRFEDPKIADPTVWYRGIPTKPELVGPGQGQLCMNPTEIDFCEGISQDTFPRAPEAADTAAAGLRGKIDTAAEKMKAR